MYDYATDEVITENIAEELAKTTLQRFRAAVLWQGSESVGGKPLRTVMRECYDQYNGILSPRDREAAEALGVDAYVNMTASKVNVTRAFIGETILQENSIPWTIAPTPNPTLSDNAKLEALELVKEELFTNGYSGDIVELARTVKDKIRGREVDLANMAARNMERLLTDQCLEGNWVGAMGSGLTEFCYYPFAVLHGPVPVRKPRLTWAGNSLRVKHEVFYSFEAPSIWDFWYTPDSSDAQTGTGVFLRQRWTRQRLFDAMRMKSYYADNIQAVLADIEKSNSEYNFFWLSANPEQPDNKLTRWLSGSMTVDVLVHYGFFSGRELMRNGFTGMDEFQAYNCTVTVVKNKVIQVLVEKNPALNIRPVYTASFYKTRDRIPCYGIAQMIRDVERCWHATLRWAMRNGANSIEPITELTFSRVAKFLAEEDLGSVTPGQMFLSEEGLSGGNTPALRFHDIPSNMNSYLSALQYFEQLAHYVTDIPAQLHGTAVGSGAMRTFRGMATLQQNALKSIQAAVDNLDRGWFKPCGELMFNYNMLYEKDDSIKGDCRIQSQGVKGMVQRELNRNNAMETLQLLGPIAGQVGPLAPQVLAWAVNTLFETMGVPQELRMKAGQPTPQPAEGPETAAPQQIAPPSDMAGAMGGEI